MNRHLKFNCIQSWIFLFVILFLCDSTVQAADFPWTSGEKLTYEISWGMILAAEGTFTATDKGDHWDFQLALKSRGLVDTFYPLDDSMWSIAQKNPWRSLEFGEFRNEPSKWIRERTQIDYAGGIGTRERWFQGKTNTFPVTEQSLEDLGSMLYHFRSYPWALHEKQQIFAYEDGRVKSGNAECVEIEEKAIGTWPKQSLLKIYAEPEGEEKKKGNLTIWITNDEKRIPLLAHLNFRYGSFDIALVKIDK